MRGDFCGPRRGSSVETVDVVLDEGPYHQGRAEVTRLVALPPCGVRLTTRESESGKVADVRPLSGEPEQRLHLRTEAGGVEGAVRDVAPGVPTVVAQVDAPQVCRPVRAAGRQAPRAVADATTRSPGPWPSEMSNVHVVHRRREVTGGAGGVVLPWLPNRRPRRCHGKRRRNP